jgi:hypothetical protein
MYSIHKYIFEVLCKKNMDSYQELIDSISDEYKTIIRDLLNEKNIPEIRRLVHKLVSVVVIFEEKNCEIMYYLKLLLNIDKTKTDYRLYEPYIKMIIDCDDSFLGSYV